MLRRETKRFKNQAIGSLILAIEIFNRPHNNCRTETVLILLQHAFEMLIKALIFERRHTVHEPKSSITYRFDKCVAIARSDFGVLTEDMAITLTMLDGYRDCAMHNLIEMSEQNLYLHAQASVTLYDDILQKAFGERITRYLGERVLPISTNPPQEIVLFMDSEFGQIKNLVSPNRRRLSEARCRLRPYLIMESALNGEVKQPTNYQVDKAIKRLKGNEKWQDLFPGVSSLKLGTSGNGLTFSVRFTKETNATPVRVLRPDESSEDVLAYRPIDMNDKYPMGLKDLAEKLGISESKTLALIRHLKLQDNSEYFYIFKRKSYVGKGYSIKALAKLQEEKAKIIDIDQWYKEHKSTYMKFRKKD